MKIYLIGDKKYSFEKTKEVIESGVDLFQLRVKDLSHEKIIEEALIYKDICKKNGVTFIINDYVDIAKTIKADGVHIGQDDMNLQTAKKALIRLSDLVADPLKKQKKPKMGVHHISV